MELAYFSGYFRLKQRQTGGAGVILRFERVRPRDSRPFQPNTWREITPQFLDRTIRALKRWNFDLVTMDEVCRRAVTLPNGQPVCLPDLRRRLQGCHHAGLSGAVEARRALHRLPGRPRFRTGSAKPGGSRWKT